MSDLSSLMTIAPNNAAFMMGQNNASSLQYQQTQQQELQQIMQLKALQESRTQQQFPLEQQKLQLGNDTTAAQLPGVQANSRLLGTQADNAAATSQSTNDLKNFDNENSITNQAATQLAAWAGKMQSVPDLQKPLAVQQMIDSMKLPAAAANRLKQRLAGVSGADLPQHLQDLSDSILAATPEMAKAGLETSAKIQESAASDRSRERTAQLYVDSGRWTRPNQNDVETVLGKKNSALARYSYLNDLAERAEAGGDSQAAAVYRARAAQQERQAIEELKRGPAPGGVSVGAVTGLQTNPQPNIAPPGATPVSPTPQGVGTAGSAQRVLVTNPDGTRGTISADKLEAALKAGYKKVQ